MASKKIYIVVIILALLSFVGLFLKSRPSSTDAFDILCVLSEQYAKSGELLAPQKRAIIAGELMRISKEESVVVPDELMRVFELSAVSGFDSKRVYSEFLRVAATMGRQDWQCLAMEGI